MTIYDYVKNVDVAENILNNADSQEEQNLAMERLELARKELNLYIKACKVNKTKGAVLFV
jgi:hypothetical protein